MEKIIHQEQVLKQSGVREIFTPFSPVKSHDFLSGREDEISSLYSSLNTPGQHALIYGERGVGKSSLVNIIAELAKDHLKYKVYFKKCSADDEFISVVSDILISKGYDTNCFESVKEYTGTKEAKIGLNAFGANLQASKKNQEKLNILKQLSSPSWVASTLKDDRALLILDEADLLKQDLEKEKLATFIKHLSDYGSQLKIILVGISSTGKDLILNHRSVERCINEIYLKPIKISDLKNIIKIGEIKLKLKFDDEVIDDIVDISGGYPHFVHLISLKCAEDAIINGTKTVSLSGLSQGLKKASRFSEGNFIRVYEEAINHNFDVSKKILLAASLCHPKGFLLSELTEMVNQVLDPCITKSVVTNCVSKWIRKPELNLIFRISRGQYKFCDPRVMGYVKMVNGFTYDKRSIVADILKCEYAKRFAE